MYTRKLQTKTVVTNHGLSVQLSPNDILFQLYFLRNLFLVTFVLMIDCLHNILVAVNKKSTLTHIYVISASISKRIFMQSNLACFGVGGMG